MVEVYLARVAQVVGLLLTVAWSWSSCGSAAHVATPRHSVQVRLDMPRTRYMTSSYCAIGYRTCVALVDSCPECSC